MTTLLPKPAARAAARSARLGAHGMRTRPLRAVLSALGIGIGIAAMVAVVSIPASSQQALREQLAALGTNLLTASPGQTIMGEDAVAARDRGADGRADRAGHGVSATGSVRHHRAAHRQGRRGRDLRHRGARRSHRPAAVAAAAPSTAGRFLDEVTENFPTVVLGSVAATRLGIDRAGGQVWLG